MKRLIFYFSATGNSLYVARELAKAVEGGEAVSIPSLMHSGEYDFEADEIGFVMPLYGHMPPNMVQEFIGRAKLKADYFFTVFTFGMRPGPVCHLGRRVEQGGLQDGLHQCGAVG